MLLLQSVTGQMTGEGSSTIPLHNYKKIVSTFHILVLKLFSCPLHCKHFGKTIAVMNIIILYLYQNKTLVSVGSLIDLVLFQNLIPAKFNITYPTVTCEKNPAKFLCEANFVNMSWFLLKVNKMAPYKKNTLQNVFKLNSRRLIPRN